MQVHSDFATTQRELDALCELNDTHTYHNLPFLLHKTAYKLAKQGNFAAYFIGSPLYLNYTFTYDNANLFVSMLKHLVDTGSLYTNKLDAAKDFEKHEKTILKPRTILDAKRLGLHPLLIQAIDAADGGLIDLYLSSRRNVQIVSYPFGNTDSPDAFYTGIPHVKGDDTHPEIHIDTHSIKLTGTNIATLETRLGQQVCAPLSETLGQTASVKILSGHVYLDAPKNYRQAKALNYLIEHAMTLKRDSSDYAKTETLIRAMAHRVVQIETPDEYEFMILRNQLADLNQGFETGYVIDSEFTQEPVSANYYTHCLKLALAAYNIICSETFTLDFEDNDRTTKDAVSDP